MRFREEEEIVRILRRVVEDGRTIEVPFRNQNAAFGPTGAIYHPVDVMPEGFIESVQDWLDRLGA